MDQLKKDFQWLGVVEHPAFCVRNGIIVKANPEAAAYMIEEGTDIRSLLETGAEEYGEFQGGCLFLHLNLSGVRVGASVTRMEDCDVFRLEQDADNRELQALALASRELRKPLSSMMSTAQKLFPLSADSDPAAMEQLTRLNRGLFQMLRVIENMSDANRYATAGTSWQELRDLSGILNEAFAKAAALVEHTGVKLEYEGFPEPVYSLADAEKLEHAVFNILSNAIKFTPNGGVIRAKLTRRNDKLYLTVQDSGSGISEELRSRIFSRYSRQPGLEDSRFGIGLGMVLIRSAATLHGGTVLVDQPQEGGTRIIMSLAVRSENTRNNTLRQKIDYSGGWDPALIALAESLPAELYVPTRE